MVVVGIGVVGMVGIVVGFGVVGLVGVEIPEGTMYKAGRHQVLLIFSGPLLASPNYRPLQATVPSRRLLRVAHSAKVHSVSVRGTCLHRPSNCGPEHSAPSVTPHLFVCF